MTPWLNDICVHALQHLEWLNKNLWPADYATMTFTDPLTSSPLKHCDL